MRLNKRSISKVSLADVLRRRRRSLQQFLTENGIVTYELLVARCSNMGISPPTHEEFATVTGGVVPKVSSPTEGVVVVDVEAKYPLSETTGKTLIATVGESPQEDAGQHDETDDSAHEQIGQEKKRRRR